MIRIKTGYINKVKKILEAVCFNCSKLKVNATTNDKFAKARLIRDKKRRFQAVWELARAKTMCEEDEKGIHGGCGQRQPVFRKDGFKLSAHFKSYRDDVFFF